MMQEIECLFSNCYLATNNWATIQKEIKTKPSYWSGQKINLQYLDVYVIRNLIQRIVYVQIIIGD